MTTEIKDISKLPIFVVFCYKSVDFIQKPDHIYSDFIVEHHFYAMK